MVLLHEATLEKRFDNRVVEKNVVRGVVKQDEYDQFLKTLPDESENAEWISLETLAQQEESPN